MSFSIHNKEEVYGNLVNSELSTSSKRLLFVQTLLVHPLYNVTKSLHSFQSIPQPFSSLTTKETMKGICGLSAVTGSEYCKCQTGNVSMCFSRSFTCCCDLFYKSVYFNNNL